MSVVCVCCFRALRPSPSSFAPCLTHAASSVEDRFLQEGGWAFEAESCGDSRHGCLGIFAPVPVSSDPAAPWEQHAPGIARPEDCTPPGLRCASAGDTPPAPSHWLLSAPPLGLPIPAAPPAPATPPRCSQGSIAGTGSCADAPGAASPARAGGEDVAEDSPEPPAALTEGAGRALPAASCGGGSRPAT